MSNMKRGQANRMRVADERPEDEVQPDRVTAVLTTALAKMGKRNVRIASMNVGVVMDGGVKRVQIDAVFIGGGDVQVRLTPERAHLLRDQLGRVLGK